MKFHLIICYLIGTATITNAQDIKSKRSDSLMMGSINEVKITAMSNYAKTFIASTQMGKTELPVTMLAKVPSLGGEADIMKALQLTPGVKRGTEGSIGMYVRGGGNDENLIMLDGAPVYNAGHLLGFFSVFNTASLKDVQLYKSSFPAQYGGRLSSVMDVRTKDGNMSDYKASASIGMISSSISAQGPLIKDKLSFFVAARRTYIDKVLRYIPYHFYDVNAKATYIIDNNNRLYVSTYNGADNLLAAGLGKDSLSVAQQIQTDMKLGNQTFTARWNNTSANDKVVTDVSVIQSKFKYDITGKMGSNAIQMRSAISDIGLKIESRIYSFKQHKLSTGLSVINHSFNPNVVASSGALLEKFGNSTGKTIKTNEAAFYAADDYTINDKWQANAGLRYSGTKTAGKLYTTLEPRIAARYKINERNAIKASYARMAQYMHLVSSSSVVLPTDLWYPVTSTIKPAISDQVSTGYYHTIPNINITISAEAYYKQMHNLVEYREGALLALNNDFEKELVYGKGWSYGLELMVAKTSGRFTGWVGYTLSYANRQFDSLNNGKQYFSKYDRRHDFSLVGMYDISKRWSINTSILYATGSPFTAQNGQYLVPKPDFSGFDVLPTYGGRNEKRLSAAFRIDLGLQYKFSIGSKIKGDAQLSIYNLLNRTQPHSIQRVLDKEKGTYKYQQKGLFGTITAASINFNI